MKNALPLLCSIVFLSMNLALADKAVDISYLPAPVQRTINEWKGQGEVKKVKTRRLDGRTVYEVDYKERGDDKKILVGADGVVIDEDRSQGKGKAKGKGKGKAKGQNRDRGGDERESDVDQPGDTQPPATATNRPVVVAPTTPTEPKVDQAPGAKLPPPPPSTTSDTTGPKTTVPAVTPPPLDPAQARAKLELQVRSLTRLDNNRAAAAAGWNYVVQQGGVTQATLQQQRKAFPTLSPVAALLGNLVSKQGGVPFSKVTAERVKGRQWGVLADQYTVPVESRSLAVDGLEKAMQAAATGGASDPTGAAAASAEARAILEQQVRSLTRLDNNRAAATAGWKYVNEHAGVPLATIQQQRKAFPNLAPVANLLGNLVSKQGGVAFGKVITERAKGTEWGVLAERYKVPVDSLSRAVAGLEESMRGAVPGATTK